MVNKQVLFSRTGTIVVCVALAILTFWIAMVLVRGNEFQKTRDQIIIGMQVEEVRKLLDDSRVPYHLDSSDPNKLIARFQNVGSDLIVTKDMQLIVQFNASGKVATVTEKELFTGP